LPDFLHFIFKVHNRSIILQKSTLKTQWIPVAFFIEVWKHLVLLLLLLWEI
jgi:hypothetical protein